MSSGEVEKPTKAKVTIDESVIDDAFDDNIDDINDGIYLQVIRAEVSIEDQLTFNDSLCTDLGTKHMVFFDFLALLYDLLGAISFPSRLCEDFGVSKVPGKNIYWHMPNVAIVQGM